LAEGDVGRHYVVEGRDHPEVYSVAVSKPVDELNKDRSESLVHYGFLEICREAGRKDLGIQILKEYAVELADELVISTGHVHPDLPPRIS